MARLGIWFHEDDDEQRFELGSSVVGVGDDRCESGGATANACFAKHAGGAASDSAVGNFAISSAAGHPASHAFADGRAINIAQPFSIACRGRPDNGDRDQHRRKRQSRGAGAAADQRSQRDHPARD